MIRAFQRKAVPERSKVEKRLYFNAWLYNRKKKPWRKLKRNFLRPALYVLLAAEAFVLYKNHLPAEDFLKCLIHMEAYTEAEPEEEGESRTERGFSIDLKEGSLKFWKSEQAPVEQRD